MKNLYILSFFILCITIVKADYWTQKADFPAYKRTLPISFSYANYGYIGWGTDTTNMSTKDMWAYNANTNTWTQKATMQGAARSGAAYFVNSITGKAYAGLGQNTLGTLFADWWEYNIATNTWASKAAFPGGARSLASGIFAGLYGYVGFGNGLTGDFNDLYLYDPVSNSWFAKPSLPAFSRREMVAFAIGNKAYFATGYSAAATTSLIDLWEFDTSNDTWTQKNSYYGDARYGASAFTCYGMGYVGIGKTVLGNYATDLWVYDNINDDWYSRGAFSGAGRFEAASFAIRDTGYIGCGGSPSSFYKDFWKYTPDTITGINEFEIFSSNLEVSPNPAKNFIEIHSNFVLSHDLFISISDLNGKERYRYLVTKNKSQISIRVNVQNLASGMYLMTAQSGKQKTVKKFLKE